MVEAIVTLVIPSTEKLVPGSGALLSRDRIVEDEPAHTKVFRLEFANEQDAREWLGSAGDQILNIEMMKADGQVQTMKYLND